MGISINCFEDNSEEKPEKKEKLKGNFDKILLMDLKKKFGTLECFHFLSFEQIHDLLRRNYRNLNEVSLYYASCRIKIDALDEELMQKKEEQVNFVGLVSDSLKQQTEQMPAKNIADICSVTAYIKSDKIYFIHIPCYLSLCAATAAISCR